MHILHSLGSIPNNFVSRFLWGMCFFPSLGCPGVTCNLSKNMILKKMQFLCTFVGKNIDIQHKVVSFCIGEEQNSDFQSHFGLSRKLSLIRLWSGGFGVIISILIVSFLLVSNLFWLIAYFCPSKGKKNAWVTNNLQRLKSRMHAQNNNNKNNNNVTYIAPNPLCGVLKARVNRKNDVIIAKSASFMVKCYKFHNVYTSF